MPRLTDSRRGVKRKITREEISKKICGKPIPLNETEPPTNDQIIQHGYYLSNSHPDKDEHEICAIVYKDVLKVWTDVNPSLPLLKEKVAKQKISRLYKNAFEYNCKKLTLKQR